MKRACKQGCCTGRGCHGGGVWVTTQNWLSLGGGWLRLMTDLLWNDESAGAQQCVRHPAPSWCGFAKLYNGPHVVQGTTSRTTEHKLCNAPHSVQWTMDDCNRAIGCWVEGAPPILPQWAAKKTHANHSAGLQQGNSVLVSNNILRASKGKPLGPLLVAPRAVRVRCSYSLSAAFLTLGPGRGQGLVFTCAGCTHTRALSGTMCFVFLYNKRYYRL